MRVALVHYWLSVMGGGEKVLEALCRLYPQADIYTHVLRRDNLLPELRRHAIRTTFINALQRAALSEVSAAHAAGARTAGSDGL